MHDEVPHQRVVHRGLGGGPPGIVRGFVVAIDAHDVQRGRISRAELRNGDTVIVGDPDCLTLQVVLS